MGTVRQCDHHCKRGCVLRWPTCARPVVTKLALAVGALLGSADPEYCGFGECIAAGDGTARHARTMAPPIINKIRYLSQRAQVLEPVGRQALAAACPAWRDDYFESGSTDLGIGLPS